MQDFHLNGKLNYKPGYVILHTGSEQSHYFQIDSIESVTPRFSGCTVHPTSGKKIKVDLSAAEFIKAIRDAA